MSSSVNQSVVSINDSQPALTIERVAFAAVHCAFRILVVFAHPTRLRCGEGGMFLGDLMRDLLHLRPFDQTESETGLRRPLADSRQPVEFAYVHTFKTACYTHVPSAADAELQFDVLFSCNQFRDSCVDFGEKRNEPRPSRIAKRGHLRRFVLKHFNLVLLQNEITFLANNVLLRQCKCHDYRISNENFVKNEATDAVMSYYLELPTNEKLPFCCAITIYGL